ncbi:CBK1 kinase activator protein Mob2p [[Candida] jaroonii]|uniref:CBK1 kinase activator protein Mob2p n=1 Tax=[Candida] jaroonii TaxID=467808 RepID=A0ACA9YF01_9ASCO|nr:CBK1 kinase activator protein Mob2p [[Candida] jaroonii]
MSFLNSIRGLGRGTKKTKKDEMASPFYQQSNHSGNSLRRQQSPTKMSPTKQRINHRQSSPVRNRNRNGGSVPINKNLSPSKNTVMSTTEESTNDDLPLFMCEPFVKTSLVKGSFKTIVQLPKYVDYGEWIALNVFEIFNNLNQFYGVFVDYITPENYPSMNAGPNTNYLWVDSNGQTVNLPACQYIEYVLTWISNKLNDQSVFPTKSGGAFPPNFMKDCKNISRQMFRIFAHMYHNHFDKIVHLSLEAHWNSFFSHFISFIKEFSLVDRNELTPLLPLIENFEQQGKII